MGQERMIFDFVDIFRVLAAVLGVYAVVGKGRKMSICELLFFSWG